MILTSVAVQGYEVSDDELQISLEEFRAKYSDPMGYPEYAIPQAKSCVAAALSESLPSASRIAWTNIVLPNSRTKMKIQARPTDLMKIKYTPLPSKSNPTPQPDCGTIYVDFCPDSTGVGTKQVRAFNHIVDENNFHTGIFITQTPISPSAVRLLSGIPGRICEHFQEQDLLVNITRHELVPKHVLLSPEEKARLLERYRLKESQLPRMQVSDPVARYLGLRRGQVVKIIRKSETAGRYASYRWVI